MKIIYLKPKGAYKSPLRSDTLWGAICWSIRTIYGVDELVGLIESYEGENEIEPFYISSAFPYMEIDHQKTHYFPIPLKKIEPFKKKESKECSKELLQKHREKKKGKKVKWINQTSFENLINDRPYDQPKKELKEEVATVTHNTIDRVNFKTLDMGDSGQLFHEEERYWCAKVLEAEVGLFFLAKGDTKMLESAIRHLGHHGIGGNRSSGKGGFDIEIQDFKLEQPAASEATAMTNLSLYHPTEAELAAFYPSEETEVAAQLRAKNQKILRYKHEVREGKSGGGHGCFVKKLPVNMFQEGSVFPFVGQEFFGENKIVNPEKDTKADHKIRHYGMAFMVNIKE